MIMIITGMFPVYDSFGYKTGKVKFGVSHGINLETDEFITLPAVDDPRDLGAKYDEQIGEWVIYD